METLLSNPAIRSDDCVKLALLYAIRYEAQGRSEIDRLDRILTSRGIDEMERKVGMAGIVLKSCDSHMRRF